MALAFIVTLQSAIPAAEAVYKKAANGKALARESERLESAARRASVPGFPAFLSESQEAVIQQMKDHGIDPARMRVPPERWYPAGDGAAMCRALVVWVEKHLNDFKQPNPILRELKAAAALLDAAAEAKVAFHFTSADV